MNCLFRLISVSSWTIKRTKELSDKPLFAVRGVRFVSLVSTFILSASGAWAAGADPSAPLFPLSGYTTSWLGNSYGGPTWVQRYTSDLYVSPDGTCYMATVWDEGARETGIYKDGKVIGAAVDTHGWGYGGGIAVTGNSRYLFVGQVLGHMGTDESGAIWPPSKTTWFGIGRRNLDGSSAPFPGGKGHGANASGGTFLPINTVTAGTSAHIAGLAVSETQLFVANPSAGEIEIYDPEKMTKTASWPLSRAGHLAYDPASNTLWILQAGENGAPAVICHYSADGKPAGPNLPLPEGTIPTAISISLYGDLLVGDSGPAQQVLIFNNLAKGPVLARTFGDKGGIYSGTPGQAAPLKLASPAGVGEDAKGNIYVASQMAGTVLESYASSGQRNWQLYGLEFVECADLDPESPNDVYTADHHYVLDSSKPSGQDATYTGYLLDQFGCPADPRLTGSGAGSMFFRKIQGKKFLFGFDMNAGKLQVYRFTGKGELTVPSTMLSTNGNAAKWPPPNHPEKTGWIWRDFATGDLFNPSQFEADTDTHPGTGWSIDTKGDIWTFYWGSHSGKFSGMIRHFPCGGLDGRGNPIYSFKTAIEMPAPAPFNEKCSPERMQYIAETDTMYLSGFTGEHPNQYRDWKTAGSVICCYDHWSSSQPVKRWEIVAPYESTQMPKKDRIYPNPYQTNAFSVAGKRLFIGYLASGEIRIYDTGDGKYLGSLLPGPEVDKTSGWIDTMYGVRANQLADGSYIVFAEEVWHEKVLIYRIPGHESKTVADGLLH